MQTLTSPMLTALAPRTAAASVTRNRTLVFEVYSADTLSDATTGQFDPSTAIALWAKSGVTWLGNTYLRRIVSHSAIEQFITGQFNNVTLTIENADRYLNFFLDTNNVNGMRLVARYINIDLSATLADSVVCFVGRLEAPTGDLDREQGDLTAQEELASLDIEVPRRKVAPDDPQGRSPNDPLFEGFIFNARPSQVKFNDPTTTRTFFGLFTKKKDVIKYNQWSSVAETDGAVVPLILGRTQRQGLPVFWTDIGFYIIGIWVFSGNKLVGINDFQLPDSNYLFYGIWNETLRQTHVHLGDPGGTGTNSAPDTIENNYPQNTALLSNTGYCGFAIAGPESLSQPFANPQMDAVPTLVAILRGEIDLPDGSGVFNQKGFSDSPVYISRFVLTSDKFFGLDPRLVYDGELPTVHAERQRPIPDKSNGEFLALMQHDSTALTNGALIRLNSTGLIDARYYRHIFDGTYPDPLITNRTDVYSAAPGGDIAGGGDQQLSNGVGLGGQSVGSGAWKYYYIDVPVGIDQLQVTLTGSGDGTTFVRAGSKPTLTAYDAFAYTASPQIVTITNPTAARWWIGIAGFQPGGHTAAGLSYSIIAVYTGAGMVGQVLPIRPLLRKAYTFNCPLTDTTNAIDFLNDVVFPSARLYRLTDAAGRQRIRAKKASDSSYLTANASSTATSVAVANVEPWRASVQGYLLIDVGETTSETRKITSATYDATVGNAVTLSVSGTGLAASGATLSGGSTTVPASGTVSVNSLASGGTVLTVTVFGISITYTVTLNDSVNSIAGMLTSSINADPNLRQYFRATWDGAHTVTIYCTIGNVGFASGLANNHVAQVASPLVAPTATTTTSGTLVPGIYSLGYTLVDGSGNETLMSPLKQITIAAGQKVSVSSLGSLPTGATGANWYFSPAHDDDQVQFLLNNAGGSFTINTVPDPDSDFPPTMNTTGCETIRVMEVFNELNIRATTLKWVPSQSQVNQVTGTFIDAANGFKPQPVTINDILHQRAVRKINKKEINLSGVDNFSQATRLCYAMLAEQRDAGERWKWATDDAGIPLEIGDVVAVNGQYVDGSGVTQKEFVNVPVMIESTSLTEDFDVNFVGVFYSTSLLEGQTGRKAVVVPTTLKYMTEPPPVALNLAVTTPEVYFTGMLVDFDFDSWAHTQLAQVFMKGPSFATPAVEPSDSTYSLMTVVYPDSNNHGHAEIRAASAGTYWIKVVTQSTFGQSAASGHPVVSFLLRPPAPTGLVLQKFSSGDRILIWQPGVVGAFLPESYVVRVRDSGTNALKRTATINVGDTGLPAKWAYNSGSGDQSRVTISADGSIVAAAPTTAGLFYKSQNFFGDGDVEFEVDDRLFIQFQAANTATNGPIAEVGNQGGDPSMVNAGASGWQVRRLLAKTKITFRFRNSTAELLWDDAAWALPIGFEAVQSTFFLFVTFDSEVAQPSFNFDQAYMRVRFLPVNPRQWSYSDGMAKQDFSSTNPTNVKFEVTQISASGIESLAATVTG